MHTVLVIDDQRAFADLLQGALASQPDMARVDVAYDLTSGLALVELRRPDVVILDVHFAGDVRDGVEIATEIGVAYPDTRVVLLTGQTDPSLVGRAAVVWCQRVDGQERVDRGDPPGRARRPVRRSHGRLTPPPGAHARPSPRLEHRALTRRESDVLDMLVLGLDAKAISEQLQISLHTCRSYIKTLLSKLHAHSQLEAVAIARRRGLLRSAGRTIEALRPPTGPQAPLARPRPDSSPGTRCPRSEDP